MVREYTDCRVRPARIADVFPLYREMRVADMLEIIGLNHHPWEALNQSFKESAKVFTLETKEKDVIAMFGVCATHVPTIGCVWLLGTERMRTIKSTFVRNSKEWVDELMGNYRCVINVVSTSNKLSMRWLKWLGAEFLREQPKGYLEFMLPKVD